LFAWAEFAHEIGLVQKLRQVPMPQKSVVHLPQAKVLTFFLGILTGITHLRDLNEGPHPLAHDAPVLRAWGLASLAHYTGISRTAASLGEDTITAITDVLNEVSQPLIDQEVEALLKEQLPLILDLDLAPRRVSNTSTTYPDAQYSWQDDRVGLGYDAALVALTSLHYGRLFLAGFHYPRNPIALPRLQKMIFAAEARLGRRPRRRPEWIKKRLKPIREQMKQRLHWLQAQLDRQRALLDQLNSLPDQVGRLEEEVANLEARYQAEGREVKPYSRLAQARRRLASARKKLARVPQRLQQAEQAVATHRERLKELRAEYDALKAHQAQMEADNAANPEPVKGIARLDAGFGTDPNVTWLIEMGYIVYTKAYSAQVAAKLKAQVDPETHWTRVGKNAEMVGYGEGTMGKCPYPLTMALERFHTPQGLKHSTLIAYRDDGLELTLPAWFDFYNERQIIEAGIKEGNVVFKMHPLKMRSRGGIALQEQFSLFAANFVRWAAVWLQERVVRSTSRFDDALTRVKTMVRVAANTSAWLVEQEGDLLVKFDDSGAYPDVELCLSGVWRARPLLLPQKKVQKFDFRDAFASGCT
jgi:cell division protein FtsB